MKKNLSLIHSLILTVLLSVLISCGSSEPNIDRSDSKNDDNSLSGTWTFEKADCLKQDGTLDQESKLIEGASYSLDISESSISYTFKLGPARNNCVITAKDSITEKKQDSIKIKQVEIKYSPECGEQQPEQPRDVEETIGFEIKDKKLITTIDSDGTFCNGLKSKHYYKK